MMNPTRWLTTLFIGLLWVATSFIVATLEYSSNFSFWAVAGFLTACALTYGLLSLYDAGNVAESDQRSRRVEKLLNTLDERDLDLLRDRLTHTPGEDGEYGSMDDLLRAQKRKNG